MLPEIARAVDAIVERLRQGGRLFYLGAGRTLREQLNFGAYLTRRSAEPDFTFRRHLRQIGGAIAVFATGFAILGPPVRLPA